MSVFAMSATKISQHFGLFSPSHNWLDFWYTWQLFHFHARYLFFKYCFGLPENSKNTSIYCQASWVNRPISMWFICLYPARSVVVFQRQKSHVYVTTCSF